MNFFNITGINIYIYIVLSNNIQNLTELRNKGIQIIRYFINSGY